MIGDMGDTETAGAFLHADDFAADTFESVSGGLKTVGIRLKFGAPFVLPGWMRAWQEVFAPRASLRIRSLRKAGKIVGLAPLRVEDGTARLIGDADVCDHLDLVCAAGQQREFCNALLNHLGAAGIRRLDLYPLRPDSVVIQALVPEARTRGCAVSITEEDVLFEMELPATWEDYLRLLSGKQRHEVRRKLRRLGTYAATGFHLVQEPPAIRAALSDFLSLFRQNRPDKAAFMDERMEVYFRLLAEYVPETRIGFLAVDGRPAAAVWCSDFGGTRYLYNSGYDADYSGLSVGLACKLLSIRDAIARGLGTYDFLKGNETYKRRLGGEPVALVRCRIELRPAGPATA
jgi:CelD/BcsL family acetyltransferase involved in cellulose biosynthesis